MAEFVRCRKPMDVEEAGVFRADWQPGVNLMVNGALKPVCRSCTDDAPLKLVLREDA